MPKSDQTRNRILEAALTLFRHQGFAETTMREIASDAGVATGAAYYYFRSKEDIVMAFYRQNSEQHAPLLEKALEENRKFENRLVAMIAVKLQHFEPNRSFLGALLGNSADPASRLSPFGPDTREMREADTAFFARALEESGIKVPKDLAPHLPSLLWLYQMGLIFFWLYDRSPHQKRAHALLKASAPLVTALIRLSAVPLLRPARKRVLEVIRIVEGKS